MQDLLKRAIAHRKTAIEKLKKVTDPSYKGEYIFINRDNPNDKIFNTMKVKHLEHSNGLIINFLQGFAPTARTYVAANLIKNVISHNVETQLGSPTFTEQELTKLTTLANMIDDITKQARERWTNDVKSDKSDLNKTAKELNELGVLKTPKEKYPPLKLIDNKK